MGRQFSLEIKSKDSLNKINIHEGLNGVLIEGNLGRPKQLQFIENTLLEIKGTNGVLRLDLKRSELQKTLHQEEITLISK